MMDNDDRQIGRILTRREVLALLGVAGSTLFAGLGFQALTADPVYLPLVMNGTETATPTLAPTAPATATPTGTAVPTATAIPACVVSPELTEGPYFVDEQLNRSDIRIDPSDNSVRSGVELQLTLRVTSINGSSCAPLANAVVDIWHCDAAGLYSDVQPEGTSGQKFLRGYQTTDATGTVQFTTIYPGWYSGRAVHVHFKVRASVTSNPSYEFTSQFFFDDTLSDQVFTQQPYASKGVRNTRNSQDNIYQNGGSQLLLNVVENGSGYTSTFDIGINM